MLTDLTADDDQLVHQHQVTICKSLQGAQPKETIGEYALPCVVIDPDNENSQRQCTERLP
jgi:hypothetical protein